MYTVTDPHSALLPLVPGALSPAGGAPMLIDSGASLRIGHWITPGTALGLAIPFALITSFLLSVAVRARRNKLTGKLQS